MLKAVYLSFIDYAKAFDNVKYKNLFGLLKKLDLFRKYIWINQNFNWKQAAWKQIEYSKIERGRRQEGVFSPDLLNPYSEAKGAGHSTISDYSTFIISGSNSSMFIIITIIIIFSSSSSSNSSSIIIISSSSSNNSSIISSSSSSSRLHVWRLA